MATPRSWEAKTIGLGNYKNSVLRLEAQSYENEFPAKVTYFETCDTDQQSPTTK